MGPCCVVKDSAEVRHGNNILKGLLDSGQYYPNTIICGLHILTAKSRYTNLLNVLFIIYSHANFHLVIKYPLNAISQEIHTPESH